MSFQGGRNYTKDRSLDLPCVLERETKWKVLVRKGLETEKKDLARILDGRGGKEYAYQT